MANQINFNINPYFDDFDENKRFLKMLFRPGYSVQARELNQLQSLLQNQVDRFGRHMFKEGSMVLPGQIGYDTNHRYAKLYDTYNGFNLEEGWFLNNTVVCTATGVEGKITDYVSRDNTDPVTVYIQYIRGGSIGGTNVESFRAGDIIKVVSADPTINGKEAQVYSLADDSAPVGVGSAAYIQEGVYFTQGFFVKVPTQKIFLDKYSSIGISYRVGLDVVQTIVTENDDITLLSNATGSPNYVAPGAHRYRVDLTLTKIVVEPEEEPRQTSLQENFIELLVIKNDTIYKQVKYTEYNIIEQTLARRTNDESGDYTVKPFLINLQEYLNDGTNNGLYQRTLTLDMGSNTYKIQAGDKIVQSTTSAEGIVTLYNPNTGRVFYILQNETLKFNETASETLPVQVEIFHYNVTWVSQGFADCTAVFGNDYDEKLGIVIEPGKAYVRGHEIEKIAKETISIDRSRTYRWENDISVIMPHGNAVYVKNLQGGIPGIDTFETASIYNTPVQEIDFVAIPGTITTPPSATYTRTLGTWTSGALVGKYAWLYTTDRYTGVWLKIIGNNTTTLTLETTTSSKTQVEIYDAPFVIRVPQKIGECRLKFLQYDTGDIDGFSDLTETNDYGKFFLHLFDVDTIAGFDFEDAQSIYTAGFKCDIITDLYKAKGAVTGDHTTSSNPSAEYNLIGSQDTLFTNDLTVNDIIYIRPNGDSTSTSGGRLKLIITNIIDDYRAKYKILSHASNIPTFALPQDFYVQFASLDAPQTNLLVYHLPHAHIRSLHKYQSNETEAIDVAFSVQRVIRNAPAVLAGSEYYINLDLGSTNERVSYNPDEFIAYFTPDSGTSRYVPIQHVEIQDNPPSTTPAHVHLNVGVNGPGTYTLLFLVFKGQNSNQFKEKINHLDTSLDIIDPTLLQSDIIQLGTYLDVYRIKQILMDSVIGTGFVSSTAVDVTSRYNLDSGQRDNYYDFSSIVRKKNAPVPTGNLRIIFDYFEHAQPTGAYSSYYCVNSYGTIEQNYDDIPTYISTDGSRYDLRDCVDFRPDISDLTRVELQIPSWGFRTDYEYYLARKDKLVLSTDGNFQVITGVPDIEPTEPATPENAMALYNIFIPAYTAKSSDIDVAFIENKRYTMRDIGKLEKRIENLEYYTTLSLLEKETADMVFKDPETGLDRFRLGFIVDPFGVDLGDENSIGDPNSNDCRCSIDVSETLCRPQFDTKITKFSYLGIDNTGVQLSSNGQILTLSYDNKEFIKQEFATYIENVNPFNVSTFHGKVELTPTNDEWKETQYIDAERINTEGNYQALAQLTKDMGTVWNNWETNWSGWSKASKDKLKSSKQIGWELNDHQLVYFSQLHLDNRGRPLSLDKFPAEARKEIEKLRKKVDVQHPKRMILEERWANTRTGSLTTIKEGVQLGVRAVINEVPIGEKVISVDYIPFMRSRIIQFAAKRLNRNTQVYVFFDNKPVSDYCGKTLLTDNITGLPYISDKGTDLVTTNRGELSGYFEIPNSDTIKFQTGERKFKLTSAIDNGPDLGEVPTYAETTYRAQGLIETKQNTILSVRNAEIITTPVSDKDIVTITDKDSFTRQTISDWVDPIAQTFYVDSEGGAFLTKIDIFFKTKDETVPIELQIREITGDQRPSPKIVLPFASVVKDPSDITVSDDATVATTFTFPAPVYVMDKTVYAICLISESNGYEVFVANLETPTPTTPENEVKNIILTPIDKAGDLYTNAQYKQYLGTFFASQNGGTWTENQLVDLKFTIYRAAFNIDLPGTFRMIDSVEATEEWETLPPNAFKIKAGSSFMRVWQPSHGFKPLDTVRIKFSDDCPLRYFAAGEYNEIPNNLIESVVVRAETDFYVVQALGGSGFFALDGNSTYSGYVDGALLQATRNKKYDVIKPIIGELNFGGLTSTSYQISTVQFDDLSKTRTTPEALLSAENHEFPTSRVVYNTKNKPILNPSTLSQTWDNASIGINGTLVSTNINVSPMIDLQRFSGILVNSRIDDPDVNINYSSLDEMVIIAYGEALIAAMSQAPTGSDYSVSVVISKSGALNEARAEQLYNLFFSGKYIAIRPGGGGEDDQRMILRRSVNYDGSNSTITLFLSGSSRNYSFNPCEITLYDYFIDEIAPRSGSCAAKYVTHRMGLANSATSLKILFAAYCNVNNYFEVYYKVLEVGDNRDLDDIEYKKAAFDKTPSSSMTDDQKLELICSVYNMKPYTAVVCKIVMRGFDSAKPPRIHDFRMIALE